MTLLGMFAVPAGKGKLEKIIKSSTFLSFPQGRVNLKNYCQRNSFEPFAPARLWHFKEGLMTLFSCSFVTIRK